MNTKDQLDYEQILAMISAFQWMPERACLRLAVDDESDDPVLKCLDDVAGEIYREKQQMSVVDAQVILGTMSRQLVDIGAGSNKEIVAETQRVVEFVGVSAALIGVANLFAVACASGIRARCPVRWNIFCECVDKPEWLAPVSAPGPGRSATVGIPNGYSCFPQVINGINENDDEVSLNEISDDTPPVMETVRAETGPPVKERSGGLSHAFDDPAFNAAADKLLNGDREDVAAQHVVISSPASVVTQCSPYHRLIQEKYVAVQQKKAAKK